ncbi:host attachment protein [Frigidibacter albus]|uniref:Host attachment protein n=1 Tax=Frigidibacter albus TaxID=1465486 RepID=A0A6L8VG43_9RHOB|nr:host attachment family protein [Frigidibacter albus]MZQ88200.1 host attachment protein [Frigidibacter albus]NBE30126.1 host attachment protein [Frigidibacter albus]GGH46852.1 host attachment protein [Frigidibacter albus]
MLFLTTGTWVVVADGAKALLLENTGTAEAPQLRVAGKAAIDNPPTREQGTDQPGRRDGPGGAPGSAMEQTDFHRLGEEAFARDLVADLETRLAAGEMKRLVLAAPPQMLGSLRAAMGPALAGAVIAELPKTLTGHPTPEIAKIVADHLAAK